MGFCFGGHLTYLTACELPIAAAASFYGGGIAVGAPGNEAPPTIERTPKIRGTHHLPVRREGRLHSARPGREDPQGARAPTRSATRSSCIRASATASSATSAPTTSEPAASDAWRRVKALFAKRSVEPARRDAGVSAFLEEPRAPHARARRDRRAGRRRRHGGVGGRDRGGARRRARRCSSSATARSAASRPAASSSCC